MNEISKVCKDIEIRKLEFVLWLNNAEFTNYKCILTLLVKKKSIPLSYDG